MAVETLELRDASLRLYRYLVQHHWDGQLLRGPDPGVRLNARFGRFIKSYLPAVSWADDLAYMQAQGYWISANWLLNDLNPDPNLPQIARQCCQGVVSLQAPDGSWPYPNPEWQGRVATVEGVFACLGLLECWERTGDRALEASMLRWMTYLTETIGFEPVGNHLSVNYFAGDSSYQVPNNSTMAILLLHRMRQVAEQPEYPKLISRMIGWLADVQLPSGELPYAVGRTNRDHFLCYQYNAFELLDLEAYLEDSHDARVIPIMSRLADYLAGGVTAEGHARYSCRSDGPAVVYYTSALAYALSQATRRGLGDYSVPAKRAFDWVLSHIGASGCPEFYSRGNYRFLSDRRSYPRYLAMMLHHLLSEWKARAEDAQDGAATPANRAPSVRASVA